MSVYPGNYDSFTDPNASDPRTAPSLSGEMTDKNDAVEAVQATLGLNPQGSYATVRARLDAITDTVGGGTVPPGGILPYGGSAAPAGYILCDGSAVSRTTFANLFAAVGVTYGPGNGSTTFNVPDLRGRFPLGKATGGTGSTLGGTGGTIDHTHTSAAHTHPPGTHSHTVAAHDHGVGGSTGPALYDAGPTAAGGSVRKSGPHEHNLQPNQPSTSGPTAADTGSTTPGVGGTGNAPFQSVNYIIRT